MRQITVTSTEERAKRLEYLMTRFGIGKKGNMRYNISHAAGRVFDAGLGRLEDELMSGLDEPESRPCATESR